MEKQKTIIKEGSKNAVTILVLVHATLTNAQKALNANGLHRMEASAKYVDYIIPDNGSEVLYLEARGADGGLCIGHAAGSGAMINRYGSQQKKYHDYDLSQHRLPAMDH